MMWLKMMKLHQHVQQDSTVATGRKIRWHCNYCKFKTGWYCKICKVYCCPEMKNSKQPRNCHREHILETQPSFKINQFYYIFNLYYSIKIRHLTQFHVTASPKYHHFHHEHYYSSIDATINVNIASTVHVCQLSSDISLES